MEDYYKLLALSQSATTEEIKEKLNKEMRLWQSRVNAPDLERRQRAEQMVQKLMDAQRVLLDEAKRSEYDQQLSAAPAEEAAEAPAVDEGADVDVLIGRSWDLLSQGRIADSIYSARLATNADPENPNAWEAYGAANYNWHDYENAVRGYEQAIQLLPNKASLYSDIGQIYMDVEEFDLAELQLQRALNIEPQNPEYKTGTGILQLARENYDAAIQIFEEVLPQVQDKDSVNYFLAVSYHDKGYALFEQGDEKEGQKWLEKASAVDISDEEMKAFISDSVVSGAIVRGHNVFERLGAFIVDFLCVNIPAGLLAGLLGGAIWAAANEEAGGVFMSLFMYLFTLAGFIYFLIYIPYKNNGQTIGKRLIGLQIITREGNPPSVRRLVARWFVQVSITPIQLILIPIQIFFALREGFMGVSELFDLGRRGIRFWHERISGTELIRATEENKRSFANFKWI